MKNLFNIGKKSVGALIIAAGLCGFASGQAGLLGTVAKGTLNVSPSITNYFDISALPGSAPVSATVVDPGVEYTGNQPSLQTDLGVTTHISADIGDSQILLTWINSGLHNVVIPDHLFTFELFPVGQKIASVTNIFGLTPDFLSFGPNSISIGYDAFAFGQGQSALSLYNIGFVNVPEPSTYMLLGSMAMLALLAIRRREVRQMV